LGKGVPVESNTLAAQIAHLTRMLKQAGVDAEAQVVAARIQSVLTDEIHHRMKNMLTMVTAIVRQSMRSAANLADAERAISARLIAMGKAHDLLLKADLKSASLSSTVHGAIDQHDTAAGRIVITGEEVQIAPASILPLTLILNELCTNAIKYGALSIASGKVALTWMIDAGAGTLIMRWIESGGPPVAPPAAKGFGTGLIENAIPRQLGGTGHLDFPPSGVAFELNVPLEQLKPDIPESN
jgi:two-component sensor histidine kinase